MRVRRYICVAGKVIDFTINVPTGNHGGKRKAKNSITKETVQKVNDRNAIKNLERLINANFDENSFHDTLTYSQSIEPEEAKRILKNFLTRVRREMKKQSLDFKWVVATEYKNQRIHHHMITNAPAELIRKKWKEHGHAFTSQFWEDGQDYSQLADYIIKHTSDLFREENSPFGARYQRSRNLIIPEVRVEEVSERVLFDDEPKPWKGYQIIKDSIRRYTHPITGLDYVEYKMIAEDEPRKRYAKGKKKRTQESYWKYINTIEEQMRMF